MSLNNCTLTTSLSASNRLTHDLSTSTEPIALTVARAIANGTASGQANRIFADTRACSGTPGAHEQINLVNFGGVSDGVGQTYALSRIVALIIINKGPTIADANDTLYVGGNSTDGIVLGGSTGNDEWHAITNGGYHVWYNPAGYYVGMSDVVKYNLDLHTAGTQPLNYDIIVIGS